MIGIVLKSVQEFVPKLITCFQSIQKQQESLDSCTNKSSILRDTKDVAKTRQNEKQLLYTIVDKYFEDLQSKDVLVVQDQYLVFQEVSLTYR